MKRLLLFPITTTIDDDQLTIAGNHLGALARQYGTPLYIYDRATLDQAVADYQSALARFYPGTASLTYAGKAFLCKAIAEWTQLHKMSVDCSSEGEIAIALAGDVPSDRVLVHGVNKSEADLISAVRNADTIVVDHLAELEQMQNLKLKFDRNYSIWLRLNPEVEVETHHLHTRTGQPGSKFGMHARELLEAANFCRGNKLPLDGIHFHLGSNFHDPHPLRRAIKIGIDLAGNLGFKNSWHFSPGGGWGVAYHEDELPQPDVSQYISIITKSVIEECGLHGLPLPHLHLEPGRSLVARAGVAIYRVGAIKQQSDKRWILIDGGMADNPRHALYGSGYSCLPVNEPGRENVGIVSIAGPYCESGDILIENLPMPPSMTGDLLAVPVSGAYQLSMSSNYNGARRPAVVWLEEGTPRLIQRRETVDDLLARDEGLKQVTPAQGDHQVKPPAPGAA